MEDFSFDIDGILSEEEAAKLFEEIDSEDSAQEQNTGTEPRIIEENEPAEEKEPNEPAPEEVGEEDGNVEDVTHSDGDGSSPSVYSSIASALKKDGIFPDFEDSELSKVKTPEDFAELFEKAISERMDEKMKRIDAALNNGVQPEAVKQYEQTLQYLGGITDEMITDEGEQGESLRRSLIYNDLINRGYSEERAKRELEKSFKTGNDIEDAKDALDALDKFYRDGYDKLQNEAKAKAEEAKNARKKQEEAFRKMVLDDEVKIGSTVLDKKTKQKVFDAVSKPVYKDPDTGHLLTAVQKFQSENPLEFLKQLGMWYVLTDGGKNTDALVKGQVKSEKNKAIRDLERKINTTSFNNDGSLQYASGGQPMEDTLLSDDWKIGWK
jgi:hypothetical protein